jgi:hypothetical protein
VLHEAGQAPPWEPGRYVPSTWPGARVPSHFLGDGSALFDHFGKGFTLVDFSTDDCGATLSEAAVTRGVPVKHLRVLDSAVQASWQRRLPDVPGWQQILGQVCGMA